MDIITPEVKIEFFLKFGWFRDPKCVKIKTSRSISNQRRLRESVVLWVPSFHMSSCASARLTSPYYGSNKPSGQTQWKPYGTTNLVDKPSNLHCLSFNLNDFKQWDLWQSVPPFYVIVVIINFFYWGRGSGLRLKSFLYPPPPPHNEVGWYTGLRLSVHPSV